jgi:hypothetical protein
MASSPAENPWVRSFSQPTAKRPRKPPSVPIELINAKPPAAPNPVKKRGGMAQKIARAAVIAFRIEEGVEMPQPSPSGGTNSQGCRMPAALLSSILGLVFFVLPSVNRVRRPAPSAGEMSFSRLGCWNCHGKVGHGGTGKPGGPYIADSRLRLRRFVGYVRLPTYMMPPYAPEWAPDVELAIVYQWLGGIEAVRTPPPIAIELKESPEVKPGGKANTQVQIEMTVLRVQPALKSDVPDLASLR